MPMPKLHDPPYPLTPRQREIVEAYVLEGLTYTETAERFGLSPQSINPTLRLIARKMGETRYARDVLRELLCQYEDLC